MNFTKTGYVSDLEVELRGTYEPAEPKSWDYPGSGPNVCDFEVWLTRVVASGKVIEIEITDYLPKDEIECLKQLWLEDVGDPRKEAYEAECERKADELKDEGR